MNYSSRTIARYKKSRQQTLAGNARKNESLRRKAMTEARRLALFLAKAHDVDRVILFGSTIEPGNFSPCSDIDLAVSGLKPGDYFKAVGQLLAASSFPVDLVDSHTGSVLLQKRISRGKVLYEK